MPGVHARVAPSALAVIVACHAHLTMAEGVPEESDTPESMEGDAAHWVNVQWTDHDTMPAVGSLAPNGVPVDEDMQEGARIWRDTVGLYGESEQRVDIPDIDPTQCWGTPDRWRYDPIEGVLHVWDYKYGHLFVDAFEFWQGIAYALGLIRKLALPPGTKVAITIVQPRSYHAEGPVRTWNTTVAALQPYMERAKRAVTRSLTPHPDATVGPHCSFCPARHECRALQMASMQAVAFVSSMERANLPPSGVAVELRILEAAAVVLEARLTGLRAQAMAMLKAGQRVPGYTVEHPVGRLAWVKPPEEVFTMGDLLGVDLRKPALPITPLQAQKKGIHETVIASYATRPRGEAKLSVETNSKARKVFGVQNV